MTNTATKKYNFPVHVVVLLCYKYIVNGMGRPMLLCIRALLSDNCVKMRTITCLVEIEDSNKQSTDPSRCQQNMTVTYSTVSMPAWLYTHTVITQSPPSNRHCTDGLIRLAAP